MIFGCRGLTAGDRARLRSHGIELVLYNPLQFGALRRNLFRDHRKLLGGGTTAAPLSVAPASPMTSMWPAIRTCTGTM